MKNLIRALLFSLATVLSAPLSAQGPALAASPDEAAPQDERPTVMLRLKSGDVLWGSIVGHEADQVFFERLANGGRVKLPWSFLDPEEEQSLRLRFGYVDASAEEIMTTADRILLTNGQEIVGLIVNRTEEFLYVKRADSTVPVAKRLVAGATSVSVPALDVFSKEELYQRKRQGLESELNVDGRTGAAAHFELAQYAERLFDYRHAAYHYGEVPKYDPDYQADFLAAAIPRSEAKAALQDQVDLLAEIDLLRARKQYVRSIELLGEFPTRFPDSPLLEDWNKMRDRVQRSQERDVREQVVARWHYWTVKLARRAARELESFEAVLSYCDEGFTEDLVQHVQEDLQKIVPTIETDEIRALWQEREGGRYRQATYSLGTWLLGEEKARAELEQDQEQEDEPEAGTAASERKKIEERLERYFQNQELTRKRKEGANDDSEDPEAFWSRWKSSGRAQWVLSYFVENSGHFNVARVRFANCRECGGTGARLVTYTGGAIAGTSARDQLVPCPTCHTIGITRRVRYR